MSVKLYSLVKQGFFTSCLMGCFSSASKARAEFKRKYDLQAVTPIDGGRHDFDGHHRFFIVTCFMDMPFELDLARGYDRLERVELGLCEEIDYKPKVE